jgi:hypothetical protein
MSEQEPKHERAPEMLKARISLELPQGMEYTIIQRVPITASESALRQFFAAMVAEVLDSYYEDDRCFGCGAPEQHSGPEGCDAYAAKEEAQMREEARNAEAAGPEADV